MLIIKSTVEDVPYSHVMLTVNRENLDNKPLVSLFKNKLLAKFSNDP